MRRAAGLPEPGERRRLREQWGLTTRQVAMGFGVTPATVRSWECGRTAPRGSRREAYRRFLAGLAQHTGVEAPGSPGGRPAVHVPPKSAARRAVPAKARPQEAAPPSPAPAGRVVGRADPVPPGRVRRLRVLGAAACAWSIAALWVILTCPPPL
ncbi:helix-turn-helix domain-containing protein [Streptomyces erythrochromogenes]|uniref:helix-turn-helix domain-containing protein n=1 Tax=Streptomyces erythrochromogenes TaxID=285574 RepID=UPI00340B4221